MLQNERHAVVRRHEAKVSDVDNVVLFPLRHGDRGQDVQRRQLHVVGQRGRVGELGGGDVEAADKDVCEGIGGERAGEVDGPDAKGGSALLQYMYATGMGFPEWASMRREPKKSNGHEPVSRAHICDPNLPASVFLHQPLPWDPRMQQPSVLVFQQIVLTGQSVAAMKRQRFRAASPSFILPFIHKTARDAKGDASRSSCPWENTHRKGVATLAHEVQESFEISTFQRASGPFLHDTHRPDPFALPRSSFHHLQAAHHLVQHP